MIAYSFQRASTCFTEVCRLSMRASIANVTPAWTAEGLAARIDLDAFTVSLGSTAIAPGEGEFMSFSLIEIAARPSCARICEVTKATFFGMSRAPKWGQTKQLRYGKSIYSLSLGPTKRSSTKQRKLGLTSCRGG